jgi:N-acetylneuraminic acid mutarotase
MRNITVCLALFMIISGCSQSCTYSPLNTRVSETLSLTRGRGGHSAGVIEGRLLVAGGTDWSEDHKTKFWLDDSQFLIDGQWHDGPELPHALAYAACGYDDSGIYLAGGTDGKTNSRKLLRLTSLNGEWEQLADLPVTLCSGAGALYNGKFYAGFGWIDGKVSNDMYVFDTKVPSQGWRVCRAMPGAKRAFPAMTVCKDYLYLFGGMSQDNDGMIVYNDSYRFSPENNQWQKLPDLPWKGYGCDAATVDDRYILIAGRADGQISKDIYLIDTEDFSMQTVGQLVIQSTTAPLIKVDVNEFWFLGGEPDSNKNRTSIISSIKFERD